MRKLLCSAGLLSCFVVKAQFSAAIIGGPQATSATPAFILHPDTAANNTMKKSGIRVGFIGNIPVNARKTLFFQGGVIYSQKGSKVQQRFDTSNVDLGTKKALFLATTDLSVNYIDIPLNLVYKLPLKGKTKFVIGGGLQASLFYSGKTSFTAVKIYQVSGNSDLSYEYQVTDNNDLPVGKNEGQFKTLHFAANALAGFEFGRVFLTANFSNALTGFYKADNQAYKFRTLGASLGIFLGRSGEKKANPKGCRWRWDNG